jgi:hypothetical protein
MKDQQMALRRTSWISRLPFALGVALGVALHVAPASATVLDFDTIPGSPFGCSSSSGASSGVPSPYGGLYWASASGGFPLDGVGLECDAHYDGPAYQDVNNNPNTYGSPSGDFAAYNSQGYPEILITPVSGTFDFFGAQFSSFVTGNGVLGYSGFSAYSVQLVGYKLGNPVPLVATLDLYFDDGVATITPAQYYPTGPLSWLGLISLEFFAGEATMANSPTFNTLGPTFLVDNVDINLNPAPIPEPGTALLLLAGLAAMARKPKRHRA